LSSVALDDSGPNKLQAIPKISDSLSSSGYDGFFTSLRGGWLKKQVNRADCFDTYRLTS